jgi:hypothetical protein
MLWHCYQLGKGHAMIRQIINNLFMYSDKYYVEDYSHDVETLIAEHQEMMHVKRELEFIGEMIEVIQVKLTVIGDPRKKSYRKAIYTLFKGIWILNYIVYCSLL